MSIEICIIWAGSDRMTYTAVFVGQKPAVAGASAIDVIGYLTREVVETVGRLRK